MTFLTSKSMRLANSISKAGGLLCLFTLACCASATAQRVYDNGEPDLLSGRNMTNYRTADDFELSTAVAVTSITFWATPGTDLTFPSSFGGTITWAIYMDSGGSIGSLIDSSTLSQVTYSETGAQLPSCCTVHRLDLPLSDPLSLTPGRFWLELHEGTSLISDDEGDSRITWATTGRQTFKGSPAVQDPVSVSNVRPPFTSNTTDLAFQLYGQFAPEPTSFSSFGMGALIIVSYARVRRKNPGSHCRGKLPSRI
jgi:hypothetical protein